MNPTERMKNAALLQSLALLAKLAENAAESNRLKQESVALLRCLVTHITNT